VETVDLGVDLALVRPDVAGGRSGDEEEREDAEEDATGHGQRFVGRPDVPAVPHAAQGKRFRCFWLGFDP